MARPTKYSTKTLVNKALKYIAEVDKDEYAFPSTSQLALNCGMSRSRFYDKLDLARALSDTPEEELTEEDQHLLELNELVRRVKTLQKIRLQQNGLKKIWDPGMAKFIASANHDMAEKSEVGGPNGSPLLNTPIINIIGNGAQTIPTSDNQHPDDSQTGDSVSPAVVPGS